jgi:hypothetical protein
MAKEVALVQTVVSTLLCLDAEECLVTFEPLGDSLRLAGEDTFRVTIVGSPESDIEIGYKPGQIVVWPGGAASVRVVNRVGDEIWRFL